MRTLVVLIGLSLLASVAQAEDAASKFAYGLEDIAPAATTVPDGWTIAQGSVHKEAPTKASLLAIAKAAGVAEAATHLRLIPLTRGTGDSAKPAVAAWLAIDVKSEDIVAKVHDGIEEKGWILQEAGLPQRMLVTWAAEEDDLQAIQAWQIERTAWRLVDRGWDALMAAARMPQGEGRTHALLRAQDTIYGAYRMEPDAGVANAAIGALLVGVDDAESFKHSQRALAKDAPIPPTGVWLMRACYYASRGLLLLKEDSLLDEAIGIMRRGLKTDSSVGHPNNRFGLRYNLACAYARKGDLDNAFTQLEKSLAFLKAAWEAETKAEGTSNLPYPQNYEHVKDKDPDLEPLRKDPRWAKLIKKYAPPSDAK